MTDNDARIGREIMADELRTTNKYERLADSADSPKVAEQVRDIAREEKVHTGEGLAMAEGDDPEMGDAVREGESEVRKSSGFPDAVAKPPKGTGSKVTELMSIKDMMRGRIGAQARDTWKEVRMTSEGGEGADESGMDAPGSYIKKAEDADPSPHGDADRMQLPSIRDMLR